MNKEEFTPGPWRRNGPLILADEDELSNPKLICGCVGFYLRSKNTFDANAALIAAAPDLYKALKEACYELCHQNGCADDMKCDHWDADREICTDTFGKCFVQNWLALLALARGEKAPKNNTKNTNNMKNKEIH